MLDRHINSTSKKKPATNRRLAQWRVKWINEHSTLHNLLWCIDRLHSEIRHYAKPENNTSKRRKLKQQMKIF